MRVFVEIRPYGAKNTDADGFGICSPLVFDGSAEQQGVSADKKLAQGDVPPLLLKNEESDGPEFAFGFLKMWKLRLPLFIDHGLASIPRTRIAVAPKIIR